MTSINSTRNNSVALSLLQRAQVSPLSGNKSQNVANTILDTISGKIAIIQNLAATAQKAKDAIQAAKTPHKSETEGTFLLAWKSAMASVGAAEIGAGGSSIARTVDNAEAIVGVLARAVNDYNGKFDLQEIESPEEWAAFKDEWLAKETEMGVSEDRINNGLKMLFEEGGYERHVSHIEAHNQGLLRYSELAVDAISGSVDRLKEAFGIEVQVSYDEEGRVSIGTFDIYYSDGQKMLNYGEDGSLTSYNEDASVKLALSNKEAAKIPMGYYRSQESPVTDPATRLSEFQRHEAAL